MHHRSVMDRYGQRSCRAEILDIEAASIQERCCKLFRISVLLCCLGSPASELVLSLDQQSCLPVCGRPSASEETGKMPGAQTCYTLPMGVCQKTDVVCLRGEREGDGAVQCRRNTHLYNLLVLKKKNLLSCPKAEEKE